MAVDVLEPWSLPPKRLRRPTEFDCLMRTIYTERDNTVTALDSRRVVCTRDTLVLPPLPTISTN